MTDNNQSTQVSSLNEKGKTGKQEETSRVSEDTEMANVEETPSLMAASLVSNDDKSVDAVMGLRVHLEELRQQIARAVVSGASQEQLSKLQEQAVI
ncbi:hypothetical protein G6F65_022569 [Rhizopus arrhizus]|nr:hypothetical protein G6F65_022569 [Rhizopus arrhizus]